MNLKSFIVMILLLIPAGIIFAADDGNKAGAQDKKPADARMDEFTADKGSIKIYFLGHASLMLDYNGFIIYADPVKKYADYDKKPKADLILITHEHGDHLEKESIDKLVKKTTQIILTQAAFDVIKTGNVLANGKEWQDKNIKIEAVPAYNTTKDRDKFHPKGKGNGYILNIGGKRIYIAGDTEDIPEMAGMANIDIAFLPMNQPYTMVPDQVLKAVNMIKPKILYPYHFSDTDVTQLVNLMKNAKDTELRVRDLK